MSWLSLGGTIAAFAVLAVIIAWAVMPLVLGAASAPNDDPRILGLLIAREAALGEARDLDELCGASRIRADDHTLRRAAALERGAAALKALDEIAARRTEASAVYAERIETALARRVASPPLEARVVESAE